MEEPAGADATADAYAKKTANADAVAAGSRGMKIPMGNHNFNTFLAFP